jgi:hypothetical protein
VRTNVFTGNAGNQWYDLSQHGPGTYLIEITSGFNNSHSYDTQIYFIANYDGSTAMGLVIGFNLGSPNIYFYSTPYGGTVPDKYALVIGTFTQSSYLSYTDWTGRYIGSSPYGASGSVRAINPATDTAYGSSNTHGEITNIWQIT